MKPVILVHVIYVNYILPQSDYIIININIIIIIIIIIIIYITTLVIM
jgi:hypothetical protein